MLRVGVVGPQSTVDRILHIAQGLDIEAIFLTYPYKKVRETAEIMKNHHHQTDFWIFSGRISYNIACKEAENKDNHIFIDHTEAGIFKGLLEFAYQTGSAFGDFSIDEISKSHLENALNQLSIKPKNIFIKTFSEDTSTDELIDFHSLNWKSGQTKGAITCYEEVYLRLKKLGIPSFRISTSDIEIKHTLNILSEKIKTFYFRDSQVAVQVFEMVQLENQFKSSKQTYQLQFMEVKLKEILINLSEQLNGSLIEKGLGRYLIFSSRGDSEREIHRIEEAVNKLILESGLKVGVGIGYGETVFSAELNAHNALKQSKEKFGSIMIVHENGTAFEANRENMEMEDFPYFNDKNFISMLENANINVKHYIELFALIRSLRIKEFTVKEISSRLSKDERNTRRFIECLCEAGLAECMGFEPASVRGRPRRIYKLTNTPFKAI
ncbi:hypothetical protein [Cytobacillus dafuensis]|uniref:Transcriptional regulator n=1 Tax=Cytobacillus dafuensis TaxID=1742359 RepID=A0A5B8Z4U5_CYTDA|nr:hypothetical protein [Cytobacillus dafuensis]QED48085.1 hypothetical protein FSZ17_13010 [Cytobacillus dafuensis]